MIDRLSVDLIKIALHRSSRFTLLPSVDEVNYS